ncbi:MAG: S46 family peptidase [Planctomycetes bacterium]|nr:S46 family peptidase [Planctomycetota bacterium]
MTRLHRAATLLGISLAALLAAPAQAQDHKELGRMWTFHNPPLDFFEQQYGFRPTQEWLDHARLASLRFADYCSASFVSPRGLIMTNHHCARESVDQVTPAGLDWLTTGFFATTLAEEVPVPGLTVQQLVQTRDVTAEMNEGLAAGMSDEDVSKRLDQNRDKLLAAAREAAPDLMHQLVDLYQGGNYQIYSYRVYDDIRLVAVPQDQIAKFGGDPDNFTYPRFSLDFSFLRAWENGAPADTAAHYLKWRTEGPTDGETVFVTGNPGSTGRLKTVAQIEFIRDVEYPRIVRRVHSMLDMINRRANDDPDFARQSRARLASLENARKAYEGYLDGLRNEKVVNIKRHAEEAIRERIDADPALKERFGDAWDELARIQEKKRKAFQIGDQSLLEEALAMEPVLEKRIGEAFFAVYGYDIPPDATMTLRISDGVVSGFPMNGTVAPYFTSLYGLYARWTEFGGKEPFDLPQNWIDAVDELDLSTPFNLVSTCDIIGGNSGSPMIDTEGRVVGLVFDGNIESLGNNFVFMDDVPRTVCVHPSIIIQAMRKIYAANDLADEIEGKGKGYK